MSNNKLINHTFFSKRPKIGSIQLEALSAGRLLILEERGNPLATGAGDKADNWSVFEALMVASAKDEVLLELDDLSKDAWRKEVKRFGFSISDDDLNTFWEIFQAEIADINASKVEEVKKKPQSRGSRGTAKLKK